MCEACASLVKQRMHVGRGHPPLVPACRTHCWCLPPLQSLQGDPYELYKLQFDQRYSG